MKRIGNKGFTVSTLLYGLLLIALLLVLLIMNNMSNNRQNTRQLVKKIDGDLNRFSNSNSEIRPATDDSMQEFLVPPGREGWYKVELWAPKKGSNGDYVSGIIYLYDNDSIFINVGTATKNNGKVDVMINTGDATNSTIMSAGQGNSTIFGYTKTTTASYSHTTDDPHNGEAERVRVYSIFDGYIAKNVFKEEIGRVTVKLVSDAGIATPPGQKSALLSGSHDYVRYIRVCNAGGTTPGTLRFVGYAQDGMDTPTVGHQKPKIAVGIVDKTAPVSGCSEAINIGPGTKIADIALFPGNNATITSPSVQIQYSQDGTNYTDLLVGTRTITSTGIHVNPWDYDNSASFESGSYYIIAATNRKAINDVSGDGVRMDPMSGATSQKWYFQKQADGRFKIINPSNNKVLSLSGGIDFSDPNYWNEIQGDTEIPVQTTQDQEGYPAQYWTIQQQGNKTYNIVMNLSSEDKSYQGKLFRSTATLDAEGDLLYTKTTPSNATFADFIIRKTEY